MSTVDLDLGLTNRLNMDLGIMVESQHCNIIGVMTIIREKFNYLDCNEFIKRNLIFYQPYTKDAGFLTEQD